MTLIKNFRLYERCLHRHWCDQSEIFTGADSLLTALDRGWRIVEYTVDTSQQCYTQPVAIYDFVIRFEQKTVTMRIIGNPYIERLAKQLDKIITYREFHKQAKTTLIRASHKHEHNKHIEQIKKGTKTYAS